MSDVKVELLKVVKIGIISVAIPVSIFLFSDKIIDEEDPNPTDTPSTPKETVKNFQSEISNSEVRRFTPTDKMYYSNEEPKHNQPTDLDIVLDELSKLRRLVDVNSEEIAENKQVEIEVEWINSPVTQDWTYDHHNQAWVTTLPYKDSMRSQPSVTIGLRKDGVVVWKRNNKD